jgi:hypothetical protein
MGFLGLYGGIELDRITGLVLDYLYTISLTGKIWAYPLHKQVRIVL